MTLVSKISPHTNDRIEESIIMLLTIRVGNRGTKPVARYVSMMGKNKITEQIKKNPAINPKNFIGQ